MNQVPPESDKIMALCRAAQSSAEIGNALHMLKNEIEVMRQHLAKAEADYGRVLSEETDEEIDRFEANGRLLLRHLERMVILEKALEQRRQETRLREMQSRIAESEKLVVEQIANCVRLFEEKYEDAARTIAAILHVEKRAMEAFDVHRSLVNSAYINAPYAVADQNLGHIKSPAEILAGVAPSGAGAERMRIGDVVRLPGANASPQLFRDHIVVGSVEDAIWWPRSLPKRPVGF